MKIWLRIGKANLTHYRTAFGTSISYDELANAFHRMGIECIQEYPCGNAFDEIQPVQPDDLTEYIEFWYGRPELWTPKKMGKKLVGYSRCGECPLPYSHFDDFDVIFVASNSARDYHQSYTNVPIFILSGGVDMSLFPFFERDFNQNPFVFLHVGTQWRKGTEFALKAFVEAFRDYSNVELHIISIAADDDFNALKKQFPDNRIFWSVRCVTERMLVQSQYYVNGHVLLFPSLLEGWGRCLGEAMASGLPCIVTKTSSMLDQFSEDCGWWIKMRSLYVLDLDDFVHQMRIAFANRNICKEKGRFASIFARNNLTWEGGIGKILPILCQ